MGGWKVIIVYDPRCSWCRSKNSKTNVDTTVMWRGGSVFGHLTRSKNVKDSCVLHTGGLETAAQEARIARPSGIANTNTY